MNTKQNGSHINSVSLFSKLFYDSENRYVMTFTCLIQVLMAQFGHSGRRTHKSLP